MRKAFRIFLYIALAYLLLATLALPPLLNWQLKKIHLQETGRELQLGGSWFNPLTLELGLEELAIQDPDGELLLGFDELAVDFSLLGTLFRSGYRFDALSLQGLQGHLRLLSDGAYSFADVLRYRDSLPATETTEPAGPAPAVHIANIDITAKRLAHSDLSRERPFRHQLNDLELRSSGFSVGGEAASSYQLSLDSRGGGSIAIAGELSLHTQQASGRLQIDDLNLRPLWELLSPQLAFRLKEGALSSVLDYRLGWQKGFQFELANSSVELADMDIEPLNPDPDLPNTVAWQRLSVSGVSANSKNRTAAIGDIQWQDFELESGHRVEEGTTTLPLVELFAGPSQGGSPEPEPELQQDADAAPWQLTINRFAMVDGQLFWRAETLGEESVGLQDLSLTVENISWPEQGAMNLQLSSTLNGEGSLSVAGALAPQSLSGQLQVGLRLPLPSINPILANRVNGEIASGNLDAEFQLNFDGQLSSMAGRSQVNELSVVADGGQLVGWQQFSMEGIDIGIARQQASIDKVTLGQLAAEVAIDGEGSSNVQRFLASEDQPQASSDKAETDGEPWSLVVKEVILDRTQIAFSDASLVSPFATRLDQLSGTITSFDSRGDQPAKVDIKGLVDEYAPIALSGTLGPTEPGINLDLAFEFDALEMPSLSAYSGTYVGRAIDQGQLQLNLTYQVEDNRLKGRNKVRIEQLSLGQKVDSPDAVSLPLGAAITLLKDVNGVISMSVPVSGDLSDPSFTLSSVVWSAFQNLIIKTVASPFKLLGSLVGSQDDLQRIPFAPGAVALSELSQGKVQMLAEALAKRPGLKLTIAGQYDEGRDTQYLQQQQLDNRLLEAGVAQQSLDDRDESWEAGVVRLYRQLLSDRPVAERPSSELYNELVERQAVDTQALLALASERAQAVVAQLIALGVSEARIGRKEVTEKSSKGSQVVLDI
ncbi:DUF748 domain-containing protein [bacterium SCSIO 12696]|nr:DUF748 domain-containing protein [bacterium SCSIO 12696]